MTLNDFKALSTDMMLSIINERLEEIEGVKDFPNDMFEFSYSSAYTELTKRGYKRAGKSGPFIFNDDEQTEQLSPAELETVREMIKVYSAGNAPGNEPHIRRRENGDIITTTVRAYDETWKQWQDYCKEWRIFSNVDLLSFALEQCMKNYNGK